MKKISVYIVGVFFCSTMLMGCLKEREIKYTGPTVVEFKNHLLGRNAAYITSSTPGVFPNASGTAMTLVSKYISVNNRATDSILVQLVGPQSATDTQIEFTLGAPASIPPGVQPSVEGVHFEFANPGSRTVTIPANSSSGYILINPIAESIETGQTFYLTIDLIGNAQVPASVNYNKFTNFLRP